MVGVSGVEQFVEVQPPTTVSVPAGASPQARMEDQFYFPLRPHHLFALCCRFNGVAVNLIGRMN